MKKKLRRLNKVEKIIVAFLSLMAFISAYQLGQAFYVEHSDMLPVEGGIYKEGVVGKIGVINPLFAPQGSLTHDVVQLVFSGLTQYDPTTRTIVPDLADFRVSADGKEYTFVIHMEAKWHDGEPITSDDVIFTYEQVIRNPLFNGFILRTHDYSGIKLAKIDERTVKFLLEKPDAFFLVKTMTGLLPQHLLSDVPVEFLAEAPFNQAPIGSGRFRLVSMSPINNHLEVSLETFNDFYGKKPHLQNVLIKVFSDEKDLSKDLGDLDGIRHVSEDLAEKILKKGKLVIHRYHLPQYVAVFMNNESPLLKNTKMRLALQLGTDKESLIESIGENEIVDTPLLEIDEENWVHQYSIKKANGALFDTEWKLPNKPEPVESDTTTDAGVDDGPQYITSPNSGKDFKTTEDKVVITGTAPKNIQGIAVNDYKLRHYSAGDKGWSYVASTEFENLKKGENVYVIYSLDGEGNKTEFDRIVVTYGDTDFFQNEDTEVREAENEEANELPIRTNKTGDPLTLKLLAPETPIVYQQVGAILKDQWKKIGVALEIEVVKNDVFQERLSQRDYELLIFGQNLGYNLDAYPYWHSTQAKEGGLNLSQFKNFVADSLLEEARLELDDERRQKTLSDLQNIMSSEVPALFLYSPTYYLAQSPEIQNVSLDHLATTSDRFARIEEWFGRVDRRLRDDASFFSFFPWLLKQF